MVSASSFRHTEYACSTLRFTSPSVEPSSAALLAIMQPRLALSVAAALACQRMWRVSRS
jgi:hypothetical protein